MVHLISLGSQISFYLMCNSPPTFLAIRQYVYYIITKKITEKARDPSAQVQGCSIIVYLINPVHSVAEACHTIRPQWLSAPRRTHFLKTSSRAILDSLVMQHLWKWEPPTEHVFCFAVIAAHQGGVPKLIAYQ